MSDQEALLLLQRRQDRLERLRGALHEQGFLRLREAAALLGVSEMTVRRDVADCDGRFIYLGGYIVGKQEAHGREGGKLQPYVFAREAETNAEGKRAACAGAAALVKPNDTVFIDCGTTLPYLARMLPDGASLTVVSYALNIAEIVCRRPNVNMMLLGGQYQASSASFFSQESLEMLGRIGITKAFISAGGIHVGRGVSCSNFHEVAVKREAMRISLKRYVVADSSKFGSVRPAFFASLTDFDAVITDPGLPPQERQALQQAGVTVLGAERHGSCENLYA